MLKKIFGVLFCIAGALIALAGVFFAFDGKYGLNSFMSALSAMHPGSPQALTWMGIPGVFIFTIGLTLILKKKPADAPSVQQRP